MAFMSKLLRISFRFKYIDIKLSSPSHAPRTPRQLNPFHGNGTRRVHEEEEELHEAQKERRNQSSMHRQAQQLHQEPQGHRLPQVREAEQYVENPPPRQARPRPCDTDEENRYGKLKFTMPKFSGITNPEEYLSVALKVDKILHLHNYEEEKKIDMASLEFQDYVLIWWEQEIVNHQARGDPPITTWTQMKDAMRARFLPLNYNRDLFKKLQSLKQGTKSVQDYYKEMEIAMIRANVTKHENQTMARFLNGLNYPINKITDFQPYSNLIELVHQATKAEL